MLRTQSRSVRHMQKALVQMNIHAKAVTAAAHKLARLIYAMLTRGEEYTDRG